MSGPPLKVFCLLALCIVAATTPGAVAAGTGDCNDNGIPDATETEVTFASHTVSVTAGGVRWLMTADLDGDDDLDIYAALIGSNELVWYENVDGLGAYGSANSIDQVNCPGCHANDPDMIDAGDLDGDGDVDLFAALSGDDVAVWYENLDGSGTFGPRQVIRNLTYDTPGIRVSDFEGDGDLDVLVLDSVSIYWYENQDGHGLLSAARNTTDVSACGQQFVRHFIAIDFDGDGDSDILGSSYTALEGITLDPYDTPLDGYYCREVIIEDPSGPLDAADLDGDGDTDIAVVQEFEGRVSWYRQGASSSSYTRHDITTGAGAPRSIVARDIDGDGDSDLLFADEDGDTVAWLANDGAGNFGTARTITTSADGAAVVWAADVNRDGRVDVIAGSTNDDTITWFENLANDCNGDGIPDDCAPPPDCNGNGLLDVCEVRAELASDADGNGVPDDCDPDCNRDGIPDEADRDCNGNEVPDGCEIAPAGLSSDCNDNGRLDECETALDFLSIETSDRSGWSITGSDLDGDGDVDIVAGGAWLEAVTGDGDFILGAELYQLQGLEALYDHHVVDLDGDQDLDIVYHHNLGSGGLGTHEWWQNTDGQGTFLGPVVIDLATENMKLVLIDLDGDDAIDVLRPGAWYRNDVLDFGDPIAYGSTGPVAAGDIDGNDTPDVVSGNVWHANDGVGNFGAGNTITAEVLEDVWLADIDTDDDLDVVGQGADIAWYENTDGAGTFGPAQVILATPSASRHSLEFVDLDGDGDVDLAETSGGPPTYHENVDGLGDFVYRGVVDHYAPAESIWAFGAVGSADIDADGNLDLLALKSTLPAGDVSVYWYSNVAGDCNGNALPDSCELAGDADCDGDGLLDACLSPASPAMVDADEDGFVRCDDDCDDYASACTTDCTDADADGVSSCAGDCDEANPNCTTDCTDVDADGYCAPQDCDDLNPDCNQGCVDVDQDGLAACEGDCQEGNPACTLDCTDADSDDFCVTADCDESNAACTDDCDDADGDGLRICDGDCDDSNANCTTDCTDADQDGYCALQDCDDGNPNCTEDCTDADSDGYCVVHDCDDGVQDCNLDCTDADSDGVRLCDGDCDESNPNCTSPCTDMDFDGFCVTTDCDDTTPHCTTDCTDLDEDGYCGVTDCDDGEPNCATDCTDADGDGLKLCAGDCADLNPHCTTNCADADVDGWCITTDCDEANPNCNANCADADSDGWCVTTDCDDQNATCTGDCTDVDGDGVCAATDCDDARPGCWTECGNAEADADLDGWCAEGDCDESNAGCNADCTDADADSFCVTTDCDDANSAVFPGAAPEDSPDACMKDADEDDWGDATPPAGVVPGTDCDDDVPSIHPGRSEVCTDNVDNDCNGLFDDTDASCIALSVSDLRFGAGSKSTLTWNPAAAPEGYAVYRGRMPRDGFEDYNHRCEAAELSGTSATDEDEPPPGEGYYYLVAAASTDGGVFVLGPLGRSSGGPSRPDAARVSCGPRVYVDPDVVGGSGSGLSWPDAYTGVGRALIHSRFPGRGLELWVRGTLEEAEARASFVGRPGVRLLGGFVGTESAAWERTPDVTPTVWDGGGGAFLIEMTDAGIVLDGMTLSDAVAGVRVSGSADHVELNDVTVENIQGYAVELIGSAAALYVRDGTFTGGQGAVRTVLEHGKMSGWIRGNTIQGSTGAALRLEVRPDAADAEQSLDIIGNRVSGCATGLVLGAHVEDRSLTATQSSFVGSNLIHGTTGDGVRVEATGVFSTEPGAAAALARPLLVGNTISGGAGSGLSCSASRSDGTAAPSVHEVRCEPEVWDNLLTFHAGPGIEESADDPGANLVSDPVAVVGNGLAGNATSYLDEGAFSLAAGALNALPPARDNFDTDPLYVDAGAGNYRLQAGSPAVDTGHDDAPRRAARDFEGDRRPRDGNGDGTGEPDVGGDER